MTDEELRTLVRDVIARYMDPALARPQAIQPVTYHHPSHGLLVVARGSEGDGSCLIEPAVGCIHCGYCQSYGH